MPDLTKEKVNNSYLKITFPNSSPSLPNSLRRILLSEIPSVSLDIIHVSENTSVLPDDLLIHRLGLVPMFTNKELINFTECQCDGFCENCTIVADLQIENISHNVLTVSSSNLKCADATFSNLPLAKLAKGQKIDVRCIGRKNIGKFNSKFSPVTVVEFDYDTNNELQHTKYWHEESVEKEWPGFVKESNSEEVKLGIEVLEGYDVELIAKKGFEVMKEKVDWLINMIENLSE